MHYAEENKTEFSCVHL